jgi:hypothetical protein
MVERVAQQFAMKPTRLVGDTNYGSAAMLGWLIEEKQITPHVPVWDKSERHDGTFGRSSFTFDAQTIATSARPANSSSPHGAAKRRTRTGIGPACMTAKSACASHNALQVWQSVKSIAAPMKRHAM